ncbi:Xaa-Pro aminopeptidase [Paenibacillus cellulosilyticus]|uniref:Xaa-Pro aminopeptidase n=1 Tax=Paenibacillus cellulosilyticus TaxID=375489 RepID=A0A2V2YQ28_9BACL|nr:Xaa-Pro peptidase family protein [Paenibacillus cellulosilyticus]PWV95592.1 Xaa-Pro aminopeptidase [Paenibacillus cellulosilyticus]QKS47337.1 aminopeptidase P family protein [Paenibacillus cellulosilyticus]
MTGTNEFAADQYELIPAAEIANRIGNLQKRLADDKLDAVLITHNVSILYWTGTMQTGYLFVPAEGEPILYVRRSIERAKQEASIRTIPLGSFSRFGETLRKDYTSLFEGDTPPLIGADLDALPAATYLKLASFVAEAYGDKTLPDRGLSRLIDASPLLRRARMVKSAWEIERIERAAQALEESLAESLPELKEGVTELEWIARVEYGVRRRGHIGVMRLRGYNQEVPTGMVGSGTAAAEPTYFDGPAGGRGLGPAAPQSVSMKRFARNEPILLDLGCCIDGYVIDQTRTAVIGELSDELKEAYKSAEHIIREVEKLMVEGARCSDIYNASLKLAADHGLADHFMGFGADQVRFLGHGIGLEIDEWPVLANGFDMPLEPGMVLAVEPKFTFPGVGVVGIENSYVITAGGTPPRALTRTKEQLFVL